MEYRAILNKEEDAMREAALAVWTLALWPLLTATNGTVTALALAGMIFSAWGATINKEKPS